MSPTATLGGGVMGEFGHKALGAARKEFWAQIERKAHSREAIRRRFADVGYKVSVQSIGGWIRGEVDPGLDVTALAAELWEESLDAVIFGQPQDQRIADRLDDQARQLDALTAALRDLGRSNAWLTGRVLHLAMLTHHGDLFDSAPAPAAASAEIERTAS